MPAEPCEPTIAICPARLVSVRPYLKHLSLSTVARRPGLGGMARRHLPDVRFRDGGAGGMAAAAPKIAQNAAQSVSRCEAQWMRNECVQNADVHPAHSDDRAEQSEGAAAFVHSGDSARSFVFWLRMQSTSCCWATRCRRTTLPSGYGAGRSRPRRVGNSVEVAYSTTAVLPASAELGTTPCGPWRRLFD